MLQIRLLGQFDVRVDGKRVAIHSRAGQSLFAYLALTAGISHRREKIAGILWPDTTEENARKNLRQELWRIRKAISGSSSKDGEYLLADEFTLKFNRDANYWFDVLQLERPDLDLQSLIANVSLYQGELLPGFYEEWVSLERERIQGLFDSRMEQLLDQLITAERWVAVYEWGERWLGLSGVRESAFRALMLASSARGDMAKVASIYQRCTDELRNELAVAPSVDTRLLYEGLIKGAKPTRSAALPSSTITFLFTDIEGSTRILERTGIEYATILAEHHKLMRAAIQKWNGREVETQGDAFFITFTRALDAVQCAADIQHAFSKHAWHLGEQIRVRMGLHTGEPLIASTGYVGMDVHRAARIGDAGHGGQVLLSQTTRELVIHDLPTGIAIRELGEFHLKDMKFPTSIFQLVIEGLPAEFPPIRTKITGAEAPMPGKAPFKGMEYFDECDADLFFGREELTEKLSQRLSDSKLISIVIGASGSGKSSLVRAGLIPTIKQQHPDWKVHVITPTAHPLESLVVELTRDSESVTAAVTLADDLAKNPQSLHFFFARQSPLHGSLPCNLLVIDQFEELFTLCHDSFEREAFIDNLLTCCKPSLSSENINGRDVYHLLLVVTLRADFYAFLAQYPELRTEAARHQEYIGPMTVDELHRAIEEPARRGYWEFEPGLVDLILRDAGTEPGALPLLSHALLETWKRRAGHVMTLKGYADAGGVRGAIAHTADNVYNNLPPDEQAIMRNILIRLTEFGEGTEDTRRRASFDELLASSDSTEDVHKVLNTLAEARLVTLGEDSAEVAHEALIREWPQLHEWLTEDREGILLHRRLTDATQEWEILERDPGALYRGLHLEQAKEWELSNPGRLNALEQVFIETSNEMAEQEKTERETQRQRELEAAQKLAETEHRAVRRIRQRAWLLAGVLLVTIFFAAFAIYQRQNSLRQSAILLAAQAESELANGYHDRAVLLALAALEEFPYTWQAEHALGQAVSYSRAMQQYTEHQSAVTSVAWSPDGKLVASSSSLDNDVHIWDPATGNTIRVIEMPKGITGNSFDMALHVLWTPDGKRLLTMTGDRYDTGGQDYDMQVWDTESGEIISSLELVNQAEPDGGALGTVNYTTGAAVDIAPGSMRLATLGGDNTALIWNSTWEKPALVLSGHSNDVNSVKWSPDETKLVTASIDGTIMVWNANTGLAIQTMTGHAGIVYVAIWSPNGYQIASAGQDGVLRIWNATDGKLLQSINTHAGEALSLAWVPNGLRLISGHHNGNLYIWDIKSGQLQETLRGNEGIITDLKWSPVDDRIVSGDNNGTARIWNVSPSTAWRLYPPQAERGGDWTMLGANWSNDGRYIAVAGGDFIDPNEPPSLAIWDVTENRLLMENMGKRLNLIGQLAYFSPDFQRILFVGSGLGPDISSFFPPSTTAYIFNVNTGEIIHSFPMGEQEYIRSTAWSRDGSQIAFGFYNGEIIILDYQTGKQIANPGRCGEGFFSGYMVWSPDGSKFAAACDDWKALVWDAKTWELLYTLPHEEPTYLNVLAWSPDGKRILTAGGNDERGGKPDVHIWDAQTGDELLAFNNHTKAVWPGSWSPDGKRVATGSADGTVRIWDSETGIELLTLEVGEAFNITALWSPDGKHIAVVGYETLISIWNVWQSTDELIAYAKENYVFRQLTEAEHQQFGLP